MASGFPAGCAPSVAELGLGHDGWDPIEYEGRLGWLFDKQSGVEGTDRPWLGVVYGIVRRRK